MDGQVDLFDLIEDKLPVPPFIVWTSSKLSSFSCGWCGSTNLTGEGAGGGGGSGPGEDSPWFAWHYCGDCAGKYGHPRPHETGYPLKINGNNKEGGRIEDP